MSFIPFIFYENAIILTHRSLLNNRCLKKSLNKGFYGKNILKSEKLNHIIYERSRRYGRLLAHENLCDCVITRELTRSELSQRGLMEYRRKILWQKTT